MLSGFMFSLDELAQFAQIDQSVTERVLTALTVPQGSTNHSFCSLQDFNVTNATPILRLGDTSLVFFQQYSLAEALYESPFYWMTADDAYKDTALRNRGRFTEEFSRERLESVFGQERVFSNVDIYQRKGKRVGEIDVLVLFGDRAVVLQAKSKRLTLEARKGNDNQLKADFKKSVQDSYDQAYACAVSLSDRSLRFTNTDGRVLRLPGRLKEIYPICVVADHYPSLSFQVRQFLRYKSTGVIQAPFVMDIFTLDVLAEMLDSPLRFLSYLNRRTAYSDRLAASHELIILAYHLKRNLWLDDKYNFVGLDDDISVELDVAMAVRRDNVPGKRIPEGILTGISDTSIGRLIGAIEARPEPTMVDFGFLLLSLSGHAVVEISRGIEAIATRARKDGQNHDLTITLSEAAAGLTVHCNNEPVPLAGPRLERHCRARKYTQRLDRWYGVCVRPEDTSLRFGCSFDYKWEPDIRMDEVTRGLRKTGKPGTAESGRKIGRNQPCPCGSGRKYKNCCRK
jgi:hypothetical protein